MIPDPYSERVRQYFVDPVHAGDLPGRYDMTALAEVTGHGSSVILAAAAEAGVVRAMRYRVKGCPHLIAAAEWLCQSMEGGPVAALGALPRNELMAELSIPVEKTGRILLLEDALDKLHDALTG